MHTRVECMLVCFVVGHTHMKHVSTSRHTYPQLLPWGLQIGRAEWEALEVAGSAGPFVVFQIIQPCLLGAIFGPLIFGNSHM